MKRAKCNYLDVTIQASLHIQVFYSYFMPKPDLSYLYSKNELHTFRNIFLDHTITNWLRSPYSKAAHLSGSF